MEAVVQGSGCATMSGGILKVLMQYFSDGVDSVKVTVELDDLKVFFSHLNDSMT